MPQDCEVISVTSASDMYAAVMKRISEADIVIGAAAVGDYTPARVKGKLERKSGLALKLEPTADIMAAAGEKKGKRIHAGFAAESGSGRERAVLKMKKKNLDLIVYNDITRPGEGFESDANTIEIIKKDGSAVYKGSGSKEVLASRVLDAVAALIR